MNMNHLKRAFCLMTAALLAFMLLPAIAEAFPYVAYATDSVRLRNGPSSGSDILAVIRQGDAVLISGADGSYNIVEYESRKGYVVSSFLSSNQPGVSTETASDPKNAAKYVLLTSGSSGAEVKALQEALQELGFYSKSIDSKFGSGTAQAVKDYQEINGLIASGNADPDSQNLLFEGMPKNLKGEPVDVKTLPPIPGYTIRPSDRGDAVAVVQQKLTSLEYYNGSIDGKYGTSTQTALKAFQKANRLASDGIIGTRTFTALENAQLAANTKAAQQTTQSSPVATSSVVYEEPQLPDATYPYTTTANAAVNLRKRADASAMRILTIPQGASIEVLEDTGNYLRINYRTYTGFVAKEYINIPEQYLDGKVLEIDQNARVSYETLAPGSEGRAVRALQNALAELGYYSGSIDGRFGSGTTAGLKAIQKQNGLRETGIALPELQQLIFEKRVRNSKNKLVYTKTLPPIDGITMQEGDFGDAIYELHEMLVKSKHFDSNAGYSFTRATTVAVRAFQNDHKIKVTGKVDAFTLLALKTSIAVPADTNTPQKPTDALTQDNVFIIREGTSGLAVTRLQQRLVELKYYSITPDGEFNSDDIVAVKHFQRVNSLPVTGIADLATQQTLYTAYAIGADAQVSQPVQAAGGLMKIGSEGEEVRALQSRLITLKYLTGSIDGIFGTQTATALTSFQRANNLSQDGIAGSQTLTTLYSATAKANQPAQSTQVPQATVPAEISLNVGSTGSEVANVQKRLIDLKYLIGTADGIYGPRTFLAVKEFQSKNSLDADGIAGMQTITKLNSSSAAANNLPVIQPVTPVPTPTPITPSFTAPRASEVRFANWYTEIRPIAQRLRNVTIYDFISGKHYNFRFFSLGKHADGTTLTAADTATMNSVLGVKNWTPRPVWVIFSDGRVYMASTHSYGHETDYISGNDLTGHLCLHFPRVMEEAALTGPYAVSHQNAILAGWDLTQNMAR